MDERKLVEKLLLIENLFARAGTEGEREAAGKALERIKQRLEENQESDPPVEYKFTMRDMWSRRLLVALLRRYGIRPYRYSGQRYTTVMAQVPVGFVDQTLWPEFQQCDELLRTFLEETTERVIQNAIFSDSSEAEVRKELEAGA